MKKVLLLWAFLIFLSTASSQVFAQTGECEKVFGGGTQQPCPEQSRISIDKKVQRPGKSLPAGRQGGDFVDNLSVNDMPRFAPGDTFPFQITVKNTGTQTVSNIEVVDTFPQFLTFVGGAGTFDSSKRILTLRIPSLEAGRSQTLTFNAQVPSANALPGGVVCVVNTARASIQGGTAQDSTQVCIEGQVVSKGGVVITPSPTVRAPSPTLTQTPSPTTPPAARITPTPTPIIVITAAPPAITPPTGAETVVLPLLGGTGLLGFLLRKKNN